MKLTTALPLCLTMLVTLVGSADEPLAASLEELAWMAGHWRSELGPSVIEEGWLGPAGGVMLGVNRTVTGDRTASFEFLRLEERKEGIVYLASPGGRSPAAPFTLVALDGRHAVFENLGHDFPQKITYAREGDRLRAGIEGVDNGEPKRLEWVFELQP